MKRKDRDERIYCSVMNYDSFVGFSVPKSMEYIIDFIKETTGDDFIDLVFDDYDEYRDYEVECASQARHGSDGTEDFNTPEKLRERYSYTINHNDKLKTFFDGICKPIKEEKILNPVKSGGLTGWTY